MKNVLVLIDIQMELISPGRVYYLDGIEPSLENCRAMLNYARKSEWEIIHIQHSNGKGAQCFAPETDYFNFINGFEPAVNEKWFVKHDYSCYSNADYASCLNTISTSGEEYKIYVIGYSSAMCVLSTLEEARRKSHPMHLIEDAVSSRAIDGKTEPETHQFMVNLYKTKKLATVVTCESVLSH